MKNTFRNILNASSAASSTFVQKMYMDEKENLTKDLNGVKFETTITILDADDTPIMVARATSSLEPEKPEAKEPVEAALPEEKVVQAEEESLQPQNNAQTPFEQALYSAYYPVQYMMPYAMPMPRDGVNPQGTAFPQMQYMPQGVIPPQMQYAPQSNTPAQPFPAPKPPVAPPPVKKAPADANKGALGVETKAEPAIRPEEPPVRPEAKEAEPAFESVQREVSQPKAEEPVIESASEPAAKTNENGNPIPFTVMHEPAQPAIPAETGDADLPAEKRKKIELLLKKYASS